MAPAPKERKTQVTHNFSAAGTADPATLPHTCRCKKRWSGGQTPHCGSCHNTFSGVATFDRHRRDGKCRTPEESGLTLVPRRAYECWGTTEEPTK